DLAPEAHRHPERAQALEQRRERGARIEVPLLAEIERAPEALAELGFERGNLRRAERLEAARASAELPQLRNIAVVGEQQRAVDRGARKPLPPPLRRLRPQLGDQRWRALELAPRRQHAAGEPRAARRLESGAALQHLHLRAAPRAPAGARGARG